MSKNKPRVLVLTVVPEIAFRKYFDIPEFGTLKLLAQIHGASFSGPFLAYQ